LTHAVVIGAGFGGMAAALRLRAAGFSVDVFDNQAQPGGRAGVYRREGYTFDAGPTVITAPFLFDELWTLFGKERREAIEFRPLLPWYRIRFADGRTFDYGGTDEELIARVRDFAPGDVAGYRRLLDKVATIYKVGFEQLGAVPFHSAAKMLAVLPQMMALESYRSVYGFVSQYIRDEALRRVFSFQPLLVGGNPFHTTSIYTLIQHMERKDGISFAMGGTAALVCAMARLMQQEGIGLHLGCGVRKIVIEDGRAVGVELDNGTRVAADAVIANGDAPAVYRRMIGREDRHKWTDARIRRQKFSMGLFVLYLGVRRQFPQLAHHTVLLGRRYKELLEEIFEHKVLADDISLYLHAPTRTDPSLAPPGGESMYALVPVPNLECLRRENAIDWSVAGPRLAEHTIDVLEATVCPGLRENIDVQFHVTPEHFRDVLRTEHGTGFSIQPTLMQSAWFRFHNRSEDVRGLYLVGAGTHPGAGLPGVLCSAKVLEHYFEEMHANAPASRRGGAA
jgi:phytoene desaturase